MKWGSEMLSKYDEDRIKICCIGDSLTYGNVGYSYIHFFDVNIKVTNRGKNGETLRGAYNRLKLILDNPKSNYDIYIIGIGTNDVFLPYLKTVSIFWFLQMSIRCKIKKCIEDDNIFHKEYRELLELLHQKNESVILLGMPLLNFKNFLNIKLPKETKSLAYWQKNMTIPL